MCPFLWTPFSRPDTLAIFPVTGEPDRPSALTIEPDDRHRDVHQRSSFTTRSELRRWCLLFFAPIQDSPLKPNYCTSVFTNGPPFFFSSVVVWLIYVPFFFFFFSAGEGELVTVVRITVDIPSCTFLPCRQIPFPGFGGRRAHP